MSNRRDSNFVEVFRAEAHHRAVTPFNAMTFTLVSLCCILLGPFNRRGQSRKVAIAAVLVIALEALNLSVVSAAKKHVELVPVLYALTFLPLGACLYFLTMPGEQQLMGLLRKWRTRGAQDSTVPQGSAA
jgi:lipopolysaccharide export system permease protein